MRTLIPCLLLCYFLEMCKDVIIAFALGHSGSIVYDCTHSCIRGERYRRLKRHLGGLSLSSRSLLKNLDEMFDLLVCFRTERKSLTRFRMCRSLLKYVCLILVGLLISMYRLEKVFVQLCSEALERPKRAGAPLVQFQLNPSNFNCLYCLSYYLYCLKFFFHS